MISGYLPSFHFRKLPAKKKSFQTNTLRNSPHPHPHIPKPCSLQGTIVGQHGCCDLCPSQPVQDDWKIWKGGYPPCFTRPTSPYHVHCHLHSYIRMWSSICINLYYFVLYRYLINYLFCFLWVCVLYSLFVFTFKTILVDISSMYISKYIYIYIYTYTVYTYIYTHHIPNNSNRK